MAPKRKLDDCLVSSKTESFWSKKKHLKELSNFYVAKVDLGSGRIYTSGEAAFHGAKFRIAAISQTPGSARRAELMAYGRKFEDDCDFEGLTPAQMKSKGGKSKKNGLELDASELAIWSANCMEVQRQICQYKFDNDEAVRSSLISSGQKILVHLANRTPLEKVPSCFWEGKAVLKDDGITVDVLGGNVLGKIWMEIREEALKG